MPRSLDRFRSLAASVLAPLLLIGCRDAPTIPAALQQLAGGEEWVAVPAPAGLPTLQSWLPYLERGTPEGKEAHERIRRLAADAARARSEGRVENATLLDREAQRIAVISLARFPEPRELQRSLGAVADWTERVQEEVALERSPAIGQALSRVKASHARAHSLLAAGDTSSAVFHLAAATEVIRDFTPSAVTLRVLASVEARLLARPTPDAGVERALHLIASARQELIAGDAPRALRRALYALQLAEGNGLSPSTEEDCLGPGC